MVTALVACGVGDPRIGAKEALIFENTQAPLGPINLQVGVEARICVWVHDELLEDEGRDLNPFYLDGFTVSATDQEVATFQKAGTGQTAAGACITARPVQAGETTLVIEDAGVVVDSLRIPVD